MLNKEMIRTLELTIYAIEDYLNNNEFELDKYKDSLWKKINELKENKDE